MTKMKTCTVVLRGCNVPSSDDPLFGRGKYLSMCTTRAGKCIVGGDIGKWVIYLFCLIGDHSKTVSFLIEVLYSPTLHNMTAFIRTLVTAFL